MKRWPDDGRTVPMEELLEPLLRLMEGHSSKYDGYPMGASVRDTVLQLGGGLDGEGDPETLRRKIVTAAFQLGIEQGRRTLRDRLELLELLLRRARTECTPDPSASR